MKNSETYSTGGYWMLAALVVVLAAPPVIGHFVMKADAKPIMHADASIK